MARKPKVTVTGVVTPPDFEHAKRIWDQDIRPARTRQKAAMKDAKEAWDEVKTEAHVNKPGFATAAKVAEMEEADQQAWLRGFNGGLKQFGVTLYADLADQAEGVNSEDLPVVPTAERPDTELETLN